MFSSSLERAILEAITYFDIFSYPLTAMEVWQNVRMRASYEDVRDALNKSAVLKKKLHNAQGMWFLAKSQSAEGMIKGRQSRYRISKAKIDKARKFVRLLRFVPVIEAVYVCNSLGYLNTREEGDIDLFIIARRGRIWTARFFAVIFAEFIGFRPKNAHAKDALCLSFFAIEGERMDTLALADDVYYLYWTSKLLPIFERRGALAKFWGNALWMRRELPQARMILPPGNIMAQNKEKSATQWRFGDFIEQRVRTIQLKIMPPYLKDAANKGFGVVISDQILKFHDHDRREHFKQEFAKRLALVRV